MVIFHAETEKVLSFLRLRGAGEKQKESSLILRKAKFQAIFKFVLSSASGGAGGGKYNRISAFVSMPVLLIRRSREKFFKKNFRDDRLFFGFAKLLAFAFLLFFNLSTAFADCSCDPDGNTLTISTCPNGLLSESSCDGQKTANNVIIGTGVTKIGNAAFWNAKSLTSITIPDSVKSIGASAFAGASSLTSITIPEGVTSIGSSAFWSTKSLTSITIPDSVTSIGQDAFAGTGLTSITIPDSVTSIGNYAFWGASSLTSITIPEGVTSIGSEAFAYAYSLESIIIPDNINTENWAADVFRNLPGNTKNIVCQGDVERCKQKLAKYIPESKGGTCTNSDFCIKKEIQPAQSSQCNGSYIYENGNCHKRNENQCNATDKYYYNGATCLYRPRNGQIVCVNPNHKANDGYCDRIRYTPAEAAEVLRDDNTNEVTITFKK